MMTRTVLCCRGRGAALSRHQREKAGDGLAAVNAELKRLDAPEDDTVAALGGSAIPKALDEVLDFSGPKSDEHIIEKFVCQVMPIENGRFRWDLNFAPDRRQAIIGSIQDGKDHAAVEAKQYGEDDEHPHRTCDGAIQLAPNSAIAINP